MTLATGQLAQQHATANTLAPLPQLADVEHYDPDTIHYIPQSILKKSGTDAFPALEDWIEIFRHSIGSFTKLAEADPSRPQQERLQGAQQFASTYLTMISELERQVVDAYTGANGAEHNSSSSTLPQLGCLELCRLREETLLAAGFQDIFLDIKTKENAAALALLPGVCSELDQHSEQRDRWEALVRGVLAGNIFDLGCKATTDAYHQGSVDFHATRSKLVSRPWVVDDLDALLTRLCSHTYRRAVLFVDNSGSDVILGMLPLARELLRHGTCVVLAANSLPSINDITAAELDALLPQVCAADPVLCKGISTRKLQVVASGSGLPVIDLRKLSEELVEAAADADLVVLEGMGRSIETNLHVELSCDSLNIGMVKHPEVAAALGGRLYDCVCRFRRA